MRRYTFTRATTAVRTSVTTRAANRRPSTLRTPSGGRSRNGCWHLNPRLEGRGAVVAGAVAGRHHRLAAVWGAAGAPWRGTVDLDLDGEAEDGPDDHQKSQRPDALEREVDRDRADEVGGDEHFESGEQSAPERLPAGDVSGVRA